MASIHVLPTYMVNKIAAGEVIERPASIVKELVENSLDARAARIEIAVADGGKKLIAVTDDGCGMSAEDLALAFAPHATSKIAAEDDLLGIETMGFRGEALASLAAVSHAHIRTRRKADDSGYEVEASGENLGEVRPCPAAPGTTVTVRDLFFNTPARRKFMRATNTEIGHVTEQLARLALPHPQVAFVLTHNAREVQNLPAVASTAQRAADLFGAELSDSLIALVARDEKLRLRGLIGTPAAARSSSRWQYVFLNGRYIRDRAIGHAIREAYRGLLDARSSPVAFIFIEIDPAEVDVNVHPTKIEVRFREPQLIHGELLAAMRETLNKSNLTPAAELDGDAEQAPADLSAGPQEDRRASIRQALADFFRSAPPPQPRLSFPESTPMQRSAEGSYAAVRPRSDDPLLHEAAHPACLSAPSPATQLADEAQPVTQVSPAIQVHNTYIVAAEDDGLVIVDQHALHERILYNDLKNRLAAGPLSGQRLLIPQTLDVTAAEAALLEENGQLLAKLGIEVASFGPRTVAVQQFPTLLIERGVHSGEFLREIVDKLAEDETTDSERVLEDLLEMLACKAAVKAGDPLTPEEIDSLLGRREQAEKASACPHGRPTALKLTLKDLEKQFKRT